MQILLVQLACLAALGASAWAAGWLAWGRRHPEHALHPFPAILGLALIGQGGLVLAAAGSLRPPALLTALAALHLAAAPGWRRALATLARAAAAAPRRALAWTALGTVAATPGLVIGLYPPHAFDETTYHLPFARALAATGSLPYLPELRTPVFPQLAETLQALALLAGGDTATHVVSLLATLLAAGLVAAWGAEAHGRDAGWLAAALLLGSPLVAYLAGTGYVEPPLAMLTAGALYAAWRGTTGSASWAVAAGVLSGSAAATKYLGLLAVAVSAVVLLHGRRRSRATAAFLLAAAACALPTHAWIAMQTGNPLHPFFAELLGPTPWTAAEEPRALPRRAWELARLPFDAVWNREAAGRQPPLSPAFALGLPLLLWAALRRPGLRALLLPLALGLAGFLVVPADARYLVPWLPIWSLALGAAITAAWNALPERRRAGPPAALAVLALALALPGLAYAAFYVTRAGAVPETDRARRAFLAAQVPGYGALDWLSSRQAAPAVVYVLDGEQLHGVAPLPVLGEHGGPYAHRLIRSVLAEPPRLARRLAALGATHLLVLGSHPPRLDEPPGWLRRVHADDEGTLWELEREGSGRDALVTSRR